VRSRRSAVLLLLDWTTLLASARGHLLSAWTAASAVHLRSAIRQPWLGPGLVIAAVLLLWRGHQPETENVSRLSDLAKRRFRKPSLERFQGVPPQAHRDLEV